MTTRYENTDGMDDKISFGEQIVKPSIQELSDLINYIYRNNPDDIVTNQNRNKSLPLSRDDLKEDILFIMDNNKRVSLPLQGMVTVSRLRKEK